MAIQIQFRRGTAAEWSSVNPILSEGEMGLELDTDLFKIGNGVDAWNDLRYGGIQGYTGSVGYVGSEGNTETDNVIYVAENGSDNYNGRSLTYPKRTIKAAVDIATYGTTIFVKSGDYTENNPINVPESVAIVGDSLRTVTVRPLNRNQDLFWVTNGVYLTQMTFKDHESPSAAVAFPTDGSAGVIHTSPYVQNCTSMTSTGTGLRIDGSHVGGLKSFVVDAYTQYNQGGIGIHHLNGGNSQLVSVFTICCDVAVLAESGGFCSMTNSNSSFGNFGLKADGVSTAKYSGTVTGDSTLGEEFQIRNLTKKPSIGDAVKFEGDPNYYTLATSTALSSGNTEISYQDFTTQSAAQRNARNSILDRKAKIQTDTIDFLNETYTDFQFNQFKCTRDIGYILDAIADDMAFGGNYKTVLAAKSYYLGTFNSVTFNEQKTEYIAALNFIKDETLRYLSEDSAQTAEYTAVSDRFDTLIDIFTNGLSAAPTISYVNPAGITDGRTYAKDLLQANRQFLIEEGIAYLDQNYIDAYDEAKCRRDSGLILDAVSYDITLGTNFNSVYAGLAYTRANASYVTGIQLPYTSAAIDYLKTQVAEITEVSSDSTALSRSNAGFNEVIDILENGAGNADALTFPSPTNALQYNIDIKDQLQGNKEFLKAEVIAYIASTYNAFYYSEEKCSRDIGLILDAVALDTAIGSNYASVTAGLAYQRASASYLQSNQLTATVEALAHARDQVLALTEVDDLVTAETRVTAAFNEIIDILQNGVANADSLSFPSPTGAAQDRIDAKDQLQANRSFLQAEVIAWIAGNYSSHTYDQAKCSRDVGYIVDALSYDILYGGNYATVKVAESYYVGAASQLGAGESTITAEAYDFLALQASYVVQGSVIPFPKQQGVSQDTSSGNASATEASIIDGLLQIIEDVITAGDLDELPSITLPSITWTSPALQDSYADIIANKNDVIVSTIDQIENNTNIGSFFYDRSKCSRDVGYIVDAVCYDILYGGNSASRQAAESYFVGAVSQLGAGEAAATADAYNFLSTTAQTVAQGDTVINPRQTTVAQYTNGSTVNSAEALQIDTLIQIIENVIVAGNTSGLPAVQFPNITWSAQPLQDAFSAIQTDRSALIDATIDFVDASLLVYDQTKCRRDIGIIIDAITYDLLYGGNSQTADAADEYYATGTLQVPTKEKEPTVAAFNYLKSVAADCLLNIPVNRLNIVETQSIGQNPSTQIYVNRSNELFDIVTNLIQYAYSSIITIDETKLSTFTDNTAVTFHQFSLITASGHTFEWVGAGVNINTALPYQGGEPDTASYVIQENQGKVYFTGTDQKGDFRIGGDLTINRNTGTITGRTFSKSLFAVLTPYILAIGE